MVTNTRPPPGLKPAPPANPPEAQIKAHPCRSCGSSDFAFRGGATVCTYCRSVIATARAPYLVEVTTLSSERPEYLSLGQPLPPPCRMIRG